MLEFFLSSHGSRKSLADTALRTADSGYMTRVWWTCRRRTSSAKWTASAAHGEKVRRLKVSDIRDGDDVIESLNDRIRRRVAAEELIDPSTGEVIVHVNEMIDHDIANRICAAGIKEVTVRSVLTCQSPSACARAATAPT